MDVTNGDSLEAVWSTRSGLPWGIPDEALQCHRCRDEPLDGDDCVIPHELAEGVEDLPCPWEVKEDVFSLASRSGHTGSSE